MKKINKSILLINICIPVCYGLLFNWYFKGVSGGDLALMAIFLITFLIHFIILLIKHLKKKRDLILSICGMIIGLCISIGLFQYSAYKRSQIEPMIIYGVIY